MTDTIERIADENDLASHHQELFTRHALAKRKPEGPEPTGECLRCYAPLPGGQRRWCDAECRDDWERAGQMGVDD